MVKVGSYVGYYGHQLQYLKKTKKLNVTTKCSVWTKYKTKRFPLPLNSITPSLDGVHEKKKSRKLIMTYVGYFGHQLWYLKKKKIECQHQMSFYFFLSTTIDDQNIQHRS